MTQNNELQERLYDVGVSVLKSAVSKAGKTAVEFELKNAFTAWTDLRERYSQHMIAWELISRMDIALDQNDNLIGWYIHSREENSGTEILTKEFMAALAQDTGYIDGQWNAEQPVSIDKGDGFQFSKCHFTLSNRVYEVSVNSESLQVIGVMPAIRSHLVPLPVNDKGADAAHARLWQHLHQQLEKQDQEAAEKMAEVFRLSLKKAFLAENNIRYYSFFAQQFYSECDVFLQKSDGAFMGWYVEAQQAQGSEVKLTPEQAVDIAKSVLMPDENIQGPTVKFKQIGDNHLVAVNWWHQIGAVNVEGDHTTVLINATTGVIFSVDRKWRFITPQLLHAHGITAEAALRIAENNRDTSGIPTAAEAKVIEQTIIEVAQDPEKPSPVQDCLVWRVGFSAAGTPGFTEVSVEHTSGNIVRVTGW